MRIGVDIDGTIKLTQKTAVEVFNRELGRNVKYEDIQTFYLDEPYGLTPKESRRLWRKLEAEIYSLAVPLENAAKTLSRLAADGNEIFFITARPAMRRIREITEHWLSKYGFPFNGHNLFMNAQDKAKVAKELAIDIFFEDAPNHLRRLMEEGIPTVVVDAPYNRDFGSLPRMYHWDEADKFIQPHSQRS
ncbi:hypothetical protein BSNK01_03330 [Bacillaceae bacterium]